MELIWKFLTFLEKSQIDTMHRVACGSTGIELVRPRVAPPARQNQKVGPLSLQISVRSRQKLGWAEFVCRGAN